jgi:HEAT repeat protein
MTFQSLLDLFPDPEQTPSAAQLASLSHLDREDTALLSEAWQDVDAERKRRVLVQLAEMAEDNVDLNFDAAFKLALQDEDGAVRAQALRGLVEYEGRDLIATLSTLLREDPEPEVRIETAIALGRYALEAELGHIDESDRDAIADILMESAEDTDAEVRREAAVALGRYALEAELDHLDGSDRETIAAVLMESAEDTDEDEGVRAKAIEALGALSGEETDNLIESIYDEDSLSLKIGAVDAMGRSCNDLWLPVVLREMENRAPIMRHAAAFAAGEIADEEAVSPLQRMAIQDPDREVRLAAIRALGEIGGAKASVALKTVLYEGHDGDREAIAEAQQELSFRDDPLRPI